MVEFTDYMLSTLACRHFYLPVQIATINEYILIGKGIKCRGEFNNASARRALVDWYLSLFIMCKA